MKLSEVIMLSGGGKRKSQHARPVKTAEIYQTKFSKDMKLKKQTNPEKFAPGHEIREKNMRF